MGHFVQLEVDFEHSRQFYLQTEQPEDIYSNSKYPETQSH
jgi:hypothetical protein